MARPPLGEIGAGPLFPDQGTLGQRIRRRAIGLTVEIVGFIVTTLLLPPLLLIGLLVDLVFWVKDRKPATAVRLVALAWWFLLTEIGGQIALASIWLAGGGPFGKGGMIRRRGIYWLRPRWLGSHLAGFRFLFGVKFEIEDLDVAAPSPSLIMIRHASIVDNLIPDTTVSLRLGIAIRYVVKRELELLPLIDIGGRWLTVSFLNRASGDPAAETERMVQLTHELGDGESVLIYPEGTRATPPKVARAKERIRESQPEVAPLADQMVNLLPPRLTGPLALLEEAPDLDVVFCGHVGFDGFERISDIWAGGLNGATIRVTFWRVPAAEIPTDDRGRIEWLYENWIRLDRWVGEQKAELGIESTAGEAAEPVGSQP